MFKVPDWGNTPKSNISFTNEPPPKKNTKQKNKKTKTPESPKQVVQAKPKFKAKPKTNSKLKLSVSKSNKKEKRRKSKESDTHKQEKINFKNQETSINNIIDNKKDSDYNIKINNYNSDKLDEMILDVKKQRLDTYKNDDNEEILFQESPKTVLKNNKNHTSPTKNITFSTKNNISTKKTVKSKQEQSSPEEVNKKQITSKNKVNETNNTNGIDNKVIGKKGDSKQPKKKHLLKSILQQNYDSSRNHIKVSGNKLRERMLDRLKAAKFRFLNEKLYTSSGSDAQQLFQADPSAFQTYHEGYQQQVSKWPVKPLDLIVKRIQKMPKTHVIADMGCGQAELAKRVAQSVRSFDLVACAPGVEACDMARTPLAPASVHVAVYCLALMGTDLTQYLIEANRVLKLGGHLLIAEVESRFDSIDAFTSDVQRLGFSLKKVDDTHQVFFFLEFTKVRDPPAKKGKLPILTLKPCIYKKR
ncbi:ribosomal RNA-processing protein 8 [Maniola jurtina]|uniref:ribosomal RNA-processing protein 8 n=1 Tax=Maniola jurtina TaxID=191418 RepID=UPI001E68FAD5|nr:ribosomal RNA-processing protein 8 [Maniola jurtina]